MNEQNPLSRLIAWVDANRVVTLGLFAVVAILAQGLPILLRGGGQRSFLESKVWPTTRPQERSAEMPRESGVAPSVAPSSLMRAAPDPEEQTDKVDDLIDLLSGGFRESDGEKLAEAMLQNPKFKKQWLDFKHHAPGAPKSEIAFLVRLKLQPEFRQLMSRFGYVPGSGAQSAAFAPTAAPRARGSAAGTSAPSAQRFTVASALRPGQRTLSGFGRGNSGSANAFAQSDGGSGLGRRMGSSGGGYSGGPSFNAGQTMTNSMLPQRAESPNSGSSEQVASNNTGAVGSNGEGIVPGGVAGLKGGGAAPGSGNKNGGGFGAGSLLGNLSDADKKAYADCVKQTQNGAQCCAQISACAQGCQAQSSCAVLIAQYLPSSNPGTCAGPGCGSLPNTTPTPTPTPTPTSGGLDCSIPSNIAYCRCLSLEVACHAYVFDVNSNPARYISKICVGTRLCTYICTDSGCNNCTTGSAGPCPF